MWEVVAPGWRSHAEAIDRHLAVATEALLDGALIGEGTEVLETACGPGGVGLAAAARGAHVTFSDTAPSMVAIAADRAGSAATIVCDQSAVDAPDETFDAVVCRHGLMFVDPPEAAVREAARVLRPGGHYGAMVWADRADNPWLGIVFDAVGEHLGAPVPPPGAPGPFTLGDPDRLSAALTAGGLADVTVRRIDAPFPFNSLEEWWDLVPAIAGPLASALRSMRPEDREAIRDRAWPNAEAVYDGRSLAGAVLVATGVRAP